MVTQAERSQAFPDYPDESRIWIYQSLQPLDALMIREGGERIASFLAEWKAHQQPLTAAAAIVMRHFLVFVADERITGVSGCAGDKLNELIRQLSSAWNVELFDRLHIPVWSDPKLEFFRPKVLQMRLQTGEGDPDALIFDHTVQDLGQWRIGWVKPLSASWLARRRPASI